MDAVLKELEAAQLEITAARQDNEAAVNRLAVAAIHLSNLRELLKPKTLPELAVSIVDNSDYNDDLTAAMKSYIDVIAASKCRRVLMFQNYPQMVQDKFPQYAVDRGLQVDFDTMWSVRRTCDDKQFAAYMEQAAKFNPRGFHFDDGHNNTPPQLKPVVDFMRNYTAAPIYVSMAADDSRLPVKEVRKNPVTGKEEKIYYTMQDYKDAGLLITRQFFRQREPVSVVDTWLKSGRILHGVNLEAFKEGRVTTSPQDFEAMLLKCLNAGMEFLSVYAVVNSPKWLMWKHAPELWQAVQAGAETVRLWQQ